VCTKAFLWVSLVLVPASVAMGEAPKPFIETGGMVVMEAENFTGSDVRTDVYAPNRWQVDTAFAGFAGMGYVTQNRPNTGGTNGTWANACELTYEVTFSTSGTFTIWLRRYSTGGSDNSVFVGLDGLQIGDTIDNVSSDYNQWVWKNAGTVSVTSGKHVFNLRRRERGYSVDRILLTTNSTYTPSGQGPAESGRAVPAIAGTPLPGDGATDVPYDAVLSWTPGPFAATHNVYFGTSLADVTAASPTKPLGVLAKTGLDVNTYDPPGVLEFGRTYYWRVDEANATPDTTVFEGDAWSFTVEPYAYQLTHITASASSTNNADMGPEKTIDGSGLDAAGLHGTTDTTMWLSDPAGPQPAWIQYQFDHVYKLQETWVWNSNQSLEPFAGIGARNVTIEYATDANDWQVLAGVPEFAKASGATGYAHNTAIDFMGVVASRVKLTINSNWGGFMPQTGLSEVRFYQIPTRAREPQPAVEATNVNPNNLTLRWRSGREAVSHQVFLSTDSNAVANGSALIDTASTNSYNLKALDLGETYSWRIDEVNQAASPSLWQGDVWRFSTAEYLPIDDFESYTNDSPHRVFQTWTDGIGYSADEFLPGAAPNGTGSAVGHDIWAAGTTHTTIAETGIVHGGGGQSMPLYYDNSSFARSEAVRTFGTPWDWTADGIKSLSLYFRGMPDNSGQLYVKINDAKVAYNGDAADISATAWLPWNIDLSAVGGNLSNVTKLTIGVEGSGAKGLLYIDDIRVYPRTPGYITPADPGETNLVALYAFEGNANDTSGHGLDGTVKQATFVASDRPGGGSAIKLSQAGYADLGNPASLDFGTADWTVTAWFKTAMAGTGDANKGTIYAKGGDNTGGRRYTLAMGEVTEGVVSLTCDDDVDKIVANSASLTNDDRWHLVAGQREGMSIKIYIDGRLEGTSTVAAGYDLSGTSQHNAYVGAITNHADGSLYKLFNGLIDDVRVYNRALSAGEILGLSGQTTPAAKPF
jgi:hypothetical protein